MLLCRPLGQYYI